MSAISRTILDQIFVDWDAYQLLQEELLTHKEVCELLGVKSIANLKFHKQNKSEKYIWGFHWKYIQKPALSKNGEVQTFVGWTKAGILQLCMDLDDKDNDKIQLFREYMIRTCLKDPEFVTNTFNNFVKRQRTILVQEQIKRAPFVQALLVARCIHEDCGALLTNKVSLQYQMGLKCRTGKCNCGKRKKKPKKSKKRVR